MKLRKQKQQVLTGTWQLQEQKWQYELQVEETHVMETRGKNCPLTEEEG